MYFNIKLKEIPLLLMLPRFFRAIKIPCLTLIRIFCWTFNSRETSTFAYRLSDRNRKYLIHTVCLITSKSYKDIEKYFMEIENNDTIKTEVIKKIASSPVRYKKDLRCDFGSRLAWYAIVRANKSKIVVENGVEIGFTAILLCEAVLKNISEGFEGKYVGLDIQDDSGYLVRDERYTDICQIVVNDALLSIQNMSESIDFYFSDGMRTLEYEKREFIIAGGKLSPTSVVVTNKLKFSDSLADFAISENKRFISFHEDPLNHWYAGSVLGIQY